MNKEILKLAIPNILTNLSIPLVSLVDLALMGHMPSSQYIIAMGFGTVIFNFIYWAFGFLRMSTTGLVSQAYGRNEKSSIKVLLQRAMFVALCGALILVLFQMPIQQLAILIIQPDQVVISPLLQYFNIRIWAAFATISVYVLTGWFLGMQDSKTALVIALIVNGLNAALSYCLVRFFDFGIAGVAWGTLIAQYVGFVVALLIIRYKYNLILLKSSFEWIYNKEEWVKFFGVNSDIFIRTLCLIFTMSFFKTKAGNIDPIVGAANILLIEFITISAYGIDGFAFAAESISGKYFGKGLIDQFKKSVRYTFRWGLGLALLLTLAYAFFGKNLLMLLTNKTNVIEAAVHYLPWLIVAPLVNTFAFIWDGIYVGTTSSRAMRNSMLIATFFIFLPAFYFLKILLGNHGLWLSFLLFMFARGIMLQALSTKHIYGRFID